MIPPPLYNFILHGPPDPYPAPASSWPLTFLLPVGIQACGDAMIRIGQHGRSVHEVIPIYLWGKGDSHF